MKTIATPISKARTSAVCDIYNLRQSLEVNSAIVTVYRDIDTQNVYHVQRARLEERFLIFATLVHVT